MTAFVMNSRIRHTDLVDPAILKKYLNLVDDLPSNGNKNSLIQSEKIREWLNQPLAV